MKVYLYHFFQILHIKDIIWYFSLSHLLHLVWQGIERSRIRQRERLKLSYSCNKVALAIYSSLELSLIKAWGLVLPFFPSPFRQPMIDVDGPWGEASHGIGDSQIPEEELNYELFVVQSLGCVWLFATPWTAAHQASLSFTISQGLLNSYPLSWWCYLTISSSAFAFKWTRYTKQIKNVIGVD